MSSVRTNHVSEDVFFYAIIPFVYRLRVLESLSNVSKSFNKYIKNRVLPDREQYDELYSNYENNYPPQNILKCLKFSRKIILYGKPYYYENSLIILRMPEMDYRTNTINCYMYWYCGYKTKRFSVPMSFRPIKCHKSQCSYLTGPELSIYLKDGFLNWYCPWIASSDYFIKLISEDKMRSQCEKNLRVTLSNLIRRQLIKNRFMFYFTEDFTDLINKIVNNFKS